MRKLMTGLYIILIVGMLSIFHAGYSAYARVITYTNEVAAQYIGEMETTQTMNTTDELLK